ncbi:MAG: hypothetical protein KF901_11230 [Myxococcales bacterium]|nr:hypothetical protein [Myxococcales bacterium]
MRACLPAGTNVAVSITFAGSGVVRRVRLPSPIERTTEGRCLREAARAARVRPFARPSQSVSVGVRGNGQTPTR